MKLLNEQEDTIFRQYLLAELSPQQESEIEEQLFLDKKFFQQLQMAEEELIDDYVYDELTANERTRFESSFLSSPERRESLRIALALSKYHSEYSAPVVAEPARAGNSKSLLKLVLLPFLHFRNPLLKFSVLAIQVLIVLGGVLLLIRALQQRTAPPPVQVQSSPQPEKEQAAPPDNKREEKRADAQDDQEPKPDQLNTSPQRNPPGLTAEEKSAQNQRQRAQPRRSSPPLGQSPARIYTTLIVSVGTVRGEDEGNNVELPSDADVAELQLPLIDSTSYQSYRATLSLPDGKTVQTWRGLKPITTKIGEIISLRVPAALLRPQKYQVNLSGVTADGTFHNIRTYPFQVVNK